ncbi:proline dehydrogenase family protein [Bacillus tuaregi]|uniref:proline dehydrogenase family protein n=1 Tax=Bacillus tuaregi TaxID=1816695 RepID=UPI0008F9392B|nr:proline dehydrogenase family protein [Bacillus tuaregi]
MLSALSKGFFLYLSKNKMLNRAAKKWGLKLGASQVVAGNSIEMMVGKVRELNERGLLCTLDHLGEFVNSKEEAESATAAAIQTLEAIAKEGLNSHLSVKMTQLGVDIDREFCVQNMRRILETARKYGNFVRIDMEDYSHYKVTLEILQHLRESYPNVGTVIQAYLRCAEEDMRQLQGVPLRLVKGAYKESPKVAFQSKKEIDENFIKLIKLHLLSGSYTAVATHDHQIIAQVISFVEEQSISRNQFEFQMLYGFRTEMQQNLANEGYKMRIYVPYGNDWFAYYMRRLAERPQNVSFALKGLLLK